jgi:septum formation protein
LSASPRLVLASASPRRRELLSRLGLEFEVRPVESDETPRPGERPEALVLRLALAKARAAARPGELALGADTVVAADGALLGKPADDEDARRMLSALSDRGHEVWTGVALVEVPAAAGTGKLRERARACRTEVVFRVLSESEIDAYVASGEPRDKAGAYAIQGGAASFVARVEGDYTNVVGLPLPLVEELLAGLSRRT